MQSYQKLSSQWAMDFDLFNVEFSESKAEVSYEPINVVDQVEKSLELKNP